MPSRDYLEVVYADGFLTLFSYFYDGEFSLKFDNCETSESYEIPCIEVGGSVSIDIMSGTYSVIAEDSDGRILSGCINIE